MFVFLPRFFLTKPATVFHRLATRTGGEIGAGAEALSTDAIPPLHHIGDHKLSELFWALVVAPRHF